MVVVVVDVVIGVDGDELTSLTDGYIDDGCMVPRQPQGLTDRSRSHICFSQTVLYMLDSLYGSYT